MKEILQRLRFAWNVIRHGVPDGKFSPIIKGYDTKEKETNDE